MCVHGTSSNLPGAQGQRSREGIQPLQDKVNAITNAPAPTNVSELRSYLGMINYYQKFLPNLSSVLAPLHGLLRNETCWHWGKEQMHAFQKSKEFLKSSRLLVHYDSEKKLTLACDASQYGLGAVLSHQMAYGIQSLMLPDLEQKVRQCSPCQENRKSPPEAPLHPWECPHKPWVRLPLDYAGPFLGKMFLIAIDAHSKWMEAFPMNASTSSATIEKLRITFGTHGLPEIVVTDNVSNFTSEEFEVFLKQNGIRHIRTAPYHPASNGLAERAVQTFEEGMKKMNGGSVETRVSRFLARYRITPQTSTGVSPAELLY